MRAQAIIGQALFGPTSSDWATAVIALCAQRGGTWNFELKKVASGKSKSSDVDSSDSESFYLKSSIKSENSQDESISYGDSEMVVKTGKIALSDGHSVGTDYACGNPEENSNSVLTK